MYDRITSEIMKIFFTVNFKTWSEHVKEIKLKTNKTKTELGIN